MPLVSVTKSATEGNQSVLVFENGSRRVGLMVSGIVDIVESELDIELGGAQQGIIGTAVINGRATEVIDHTWWLAQVSTPSIGITTVPNRARTAA